MEQHSFDLENAQIIDRTHKSENLPILECCHIKTTENTVNIRTDTQKHLHVAYAGVLHKLSKFKKQKTTHKHNTS